MRRSLVRRSDSLAYKVSNKKNHVLCRTTCDEAVIDVPFRGTLIKNSGEARLFIGMFRTSMSVATIRYEL